MAGCLRPPFGGGAPVAVELPELPAPLEERLSVTGAELAYLGTDGTVEVLELQEWGPVGIEVPRISWVPVVARMRVEGVWGERLCCGGYRSIDSTAEECLELNWEDGCLAEFLLRYLARTGREVWFNLGKLRAAVAEATGGNPWDLDLPLLATGFEHYYLSSSVIRPAKAVGSDRILPTGRWYRLDPLDPGPVEMQGPNETISMVPGLHAFVSEDREDVVEVFVSDVGWTRIVNRSPESAESGMW